MKEMRRKRERGKCATRSMEYSANERDRKGGTKRKKYNKISIIFIE